MPTFIQDIRVFLVSSMLVIEIWHDIFCLGTRWSNSYPLYKKHRFLNFVLQLLCNRILKVTIQLATKLALAKSLPTAENDHPQLERSIIEGGVVISWNACRSRV